MLEDNLSGLQDTILNFVLELKKNLDHPNFPVAFASPPANKTSTNVIFKQDSKMSF